MPEFNSCGPCGRRKEPTPKGDLSPPDVHHGQQSSSTAVQKINTCKNSGFIIFKSVEVCAFAYGHVSAGAQGDWSCERPDVGTWVL